MARISNDSIRKIKENVRISDVFEWLGAKVVRRGHNTMAFCPFCEDANSKNPGCSLNDELGLFHCFVCQESGDAITAVMEHENVNFPEAVEMMANRFNIPVDYDQSHDSEAESRRKRLVSVLEAAQAEFLAQRSNHHYADFLQERNLSEVDADRFELGLSLYTEAAGVLARLTERFGQDDIIASGLAYRDEERGDLHLRFVNRLMIPIRTAPGTLVGFGARDLTGKSPAKYKNSPESELFKKRNILYGMNVARKTIGKTSNAIVCEGYMDTIALHSQGYHQSIGAMGTALTTSNLQHLSTLADTIYVALDSDAAGIAAAMRVASAIPEDYRSDVKVLTIPAIQCNSEAEVRAISKNKADEYLFEKITLPDGNTDEIPIDFPIMVPLAKDLDEFFNQFNHSKEEFDEIVANAEDLFSFCAKQTLSTRVKELDDEVAGNGDTVKMAQIRMDAKRELDELMMRIYSKTNIYQRQNIANYAISALGLVDTAKQMEDEWKRRVATSAARSFDVKKNAKADLSQLGAISSQVTSEEDLLISTLYFHPECRLIIRQNLEDLEQVFTSPVRRGIFNKIDAAYGKGKTALDAQNEDMDENEVKELGRIVMKLDANEEQSKELSDETIEDICRKLEKHALENEIEKESQAATPNVMKIIELKMKLAQYES